MPSLVCLWLLPRQQLKLEAISSCVGCKTCLGIGMKNIQIFHITPQKAIYKWYILPIGGLYNQKQPLKFEDSSHVLMCLSWGVPLYQHFADLAGNGAKLTLPVPCFNVINGGSHAGQRVGLGMRKMFGDGAETQGLSVRVRRSYFILLYITVLYDIWSILIICCSCLTLFYVICRYSNTIHSFAFDCVCCLVSVKPCCVSTRSYSVMLPSHSMIFHDFGEGKHEDGNWDISWKWSRLQLQGASTSQLRRYLYNELTVWVFWWSLV